MSFSSEATYKQVTDPWRVSFQSKYRICKQYSSCLFEVVVVEVFVGHVRLCCSSSVGVMKNLNNALQGASCLTLSFNLSVTIAKKKKKQSDPIAIVIS